MTERDIDTEKTARIAHLRITAYEAAKVMRFTDSWLCEFMDNENICAALREMGEWDALCGFQDVLKEQRQKLVDALEASKATSDE